MKSANNVKASYAKWSQTYDHVENPTRDLDKKVIRKILVNLKGKDVIEAGCGTGKNTIWLMKTAKSVISFDLSKEMLNIARQKITGVNVKFVRHDITKKWFFPNDCCDVVTINLVLEHIEKINFVFKEAYRVLRKNEKLFVCELHPDKQKKGTKARFTELDGNTLVEIDSYYHSKTDYIKAGVIAGFKKIILKDWFDEKESNQVPRLLSMLLKK
ncbi:MAG: class I SAM-dependent methyltransferase [Bacteroidota bacterium]|nr:class I SAM-dependent methyltransferase [Bacteroidota bacterium]